MEVAKEEKAARGKDMYDNPGEAMERSKDMSCAIGVHTHKNALAIQFSCLAKHTKSTKKLSAKVTMTMTKTIKKDTEMTKMK